MFALLVNAALAAPQFVADDPADAALARAAWTAAEACTGWTPKAHATVVIERRGIQKAYLGMAVSDEAGLKTIQLDPDQGGRDVLVHEVAHAWVKKGPTALVEGRAELLADCMVHRNAGLAPLQWDDGRELTAMPALHTWDSTEDHGPTVNPMLRTDAYLGAARLVRLASLILPERALWPEADDVSWADLDALLVKTGPVGNPLRGVLLADAATQQAALSDRDADGLVDLGEQMFHTDPERFDSDGDGWWDGAAVPVGVKPLPFDGTPVCTGWALPATGGTVLLRTGGGLRGAPAPTPQIRVIGRAWKPTTDGVQVPRSGSILVELNGDPGRASGGLWAQVEGQGLVRDAHCVSEATRVVWANEPALRNHVRAFSDALAASLERADSVFGGGTARVAVQLGGGLTTIDGPIVYLSTAEVEQAAATGRYEALANQAVAMRRVWDGSFQRSWRDVIAISRALGSDRVDALVAEDSTP